MPGKARDMHVAELRSSFARIKETSNMLDHCWVEVYSDETCQTKLNAGYVDNASSMFEQLCKYLPWNEWNEVYMCPPQLYKNKTLIYKTFYGEDPLEGNAKMRINNFTEPIFILRPKELLVIIHRPKPLNRYAVP